MRPMRAFFAIFGFMAVLPAAATPVHYTIDPKHTYVSLAVPHIAGISHWRGKFDRTESGWVILDRQRHTGALEVTIDTGSLNFGFAPMTREATSPKVLDAARYPTAVYKASKIKFDGNVPAEVDGELTLHGVTRPVPLKIRSFKCITDPFLKVQRCGADVSADFNRSDFGVGYDVDLMGSGDVALQIQVEALNTAEIKAKQASGR